MIPNSHPACPQMPRSDRTGPSLGHQPGHAAPEAVATHTPRNARSTGDPAAWRHSPVGICNSRHGTRHNQSREINSSPDSDRSGWVHESLAHCQTA